MHLNRFGLVMFHKTITAGLREPTGSTHLKCHAIEVQESPRPHANGRPNDKAAGVTCCSSRSHNTQPGAGP